MAIVRLLRTAKHFKKKIQRKGAKTERRKDKTTNHLVRDASRSVLRRFPRGFATMRRTSLSAFIVAKENQCQMQSFRRAPAIWGFPSKARRVSSTRSPTSTGVLVGHTTLIAGDGALEVGRGPVRTGVTAVLPRGRKYDPVFAASYVLNGNGEMTGTIWVEESGFLEGPICHHQHPQRRRRPRRGDRVGGGESDFRPAAARSLLGAAGRRRDLRRHPQRRERLSRPAASTSSPPSTARPVDRSKKARSAAARG